MPLMSFEIYFDLGTEPSMNRKIVNYCNIFLEISGNQGKLGIWGFRGDVGFGGFGGDGAFWA